MRVGFAAAGCWVRCGGIVVLMDVVAMFCYGLQLSETLTMLKTVSSSGRWKSSGYRIMAVDVWWTDDGIISIVLMMFLVDRRDGIAQRRVVMHVILFVHGIYIYTPSDISRQKKLEMRRIT